MTSRIFDRFPIARTLAVLVVVCSLFIPTQTAYAQQRQPGIFAQIVVNGQCLDWRLLNGNSVVTVWGCDDFRAAQWWTQDQYGRIQNAVGKCLDVHSPDIYLNGAAVNMQECNASPAQLWNTGNANKLINNGGGLCLDVNASELGSNGARVQAWECNDSLQQSFNFASNGQWGEQYRQIRHDTVDRCSQDVEFLPDSGASSPSVWLPKINGAWARFSVSKYIDGDENIVWWKCGKDSYGKSRCPRAANEIYVIRVDGRKFLVGCYVTTWHFGLNLYRGLQ